MGSTVSFSQGEDYSNSHVRSDPRLSIAVSVDAESNHALIEAQSRETPYALGCSLMAQALFGYGEVESCPLVVDDEALVANGNCPLEGSARSFVHFPRGARAIG